MYVCNVQVMQMLLDWFWEICGLSGIKEGCNEGDCGVCLVVVQDEGGIKVLNVCIFFMLQFQGKMVCMVEGVFSLEGDLYLV